MRATTPMTEAVPYACRLVLRLRRQHEAVVAERQMARIALEAGEDLPFTGITAAGDARRLRGIPALAPGVGGAVAGSRPGQGGIFRDD